MNEIRNCEFKFKCPKEWKSLQLTDQEDQRYCDECNQIVYFCRTGKQLMAAIKADRCVAVGTDDADSGLTQLEVGMPAPRYNLDD
jgi:hypothetical protein